MSKEEERRQALLQLAAEEEERRQQQEAEEAVCVFSRLLDEGCGIRHKTLGYGVLDGHRGPYLVLKFPQHGRRVHFDLRQTLHRGILRLDVPEFDALLARYGEALRRCRD